MTKATKPTTTDAGAPVASDEHSLTIGADGPIVLNDHYLIEQMANFNRERIPERQPHAKGGGAFGHFQVTHDVSRYTRAAVFQPGTRTEILIRFSTVAGERGSPDTWRDPRGHRVESGQDAAGARLFLRRRAPRAPRRQLQANSGEPTEITRVQLQQGRCDAGSERVGPGLRTELLRRP
jgi:Catalase